MFLYPAPGVHESFRITTDAQPNPLLCSVLLISPSNQILLLHRVQSSKSFPSAHVFPGGNLESEQDGEIPGPEDAMRHEDSMVYRLAAIRECFEESGILLAKKLGSSSELIKLSDELLGEGRRSIYENKVGFKDWVAQHGGYPDTGIFHCPNILCNMAVC